jgi:PleD family two-component response regulator
MIIVAVDDLLFSSRIRNVAKGAGVDILFARSPEAIVDALHTTAATLVILDLNSAPVRPLEAVAAIKADPALEHVRTIGFVSHVQSDLIAQAREAGVDRVMARSAFASDLPLLLAGG